MIGFLMLGKNLNKTYAIFMFLGATPWVYYFVYHLNYGVEDIIWFCVFNFIMLLLCGVTTYLYGFKNIHKQVITYAFGFGIAYASFYFDIKGIVYIYPYIVAMYYAYSSNKALIFSVLFAVIALFAVSYQQDIRIVIGLSISITVTIVTSYLYSRILKYNQDQLVTEANKDYLTGIANKRNMMRWLKQQLISLQPSSMLVLFYIDIDNFKRINDTYGHVIGDLVLKEVSQKLIHFIGSLQENTENKDIIASRISGDEFLIIMKKSDLVSCIDRRANELLEIINEPIKIERIKFNLKACVGVYTTADSQKRALDVINSADQAMFKAKKSGRNLVAFFDDKLADDLAIKNKITIALDNAIEQDSFLLNFMPIYSSFKMIGVEVLIRSCDPVLSQYGPDKYIPIAEEMGHIYLIDLIVIEKTFIEISALLPVITDLDFVFAINISALELSSDSFLAEILKLTDKYNIPPKIIEFEITETSLVGREENTIKTLEALRSKGYKLSLDDFGTGYTAFSQLQSYPVNTLKIDRSFINNISKEDKKINSMVEVILSLAKLYELDVVAEGVEEQFQLDYLQSLGCNAFQGYLLSKPLGIDDFKLKFHQEAGIPK
jgi:diguanylate cyclase (GGDEF)-like protein